MTPSRDITTRLNAYRQHSALCAEAADEIDRLRAEVERLTEAGVGYSQQTVDALTKERDGLTAKLTAARQVMRHVLSELGQTDDWRTVDGLQDEIAAYLLGIAQEPA